MRACIVSCLLSHLEAIRCSLSKTPVYAQNRAFCADSPTVCIACTLGAGQILYQIEDKTASFNLIYNLACSESATVFYMAISAQNRNFPTFFGDLTVFKDIIDTILVLLWKN